MKLKKLIGVMMLVLMGFSVLGYGLSAEKKNYKGNYSSTGQQKERQESGTPPVNPQPNQEKVTVKLFFSDKQAMYLKSEERLVAKSGRQIAEVMIEELIKGPEGDDLIKTIPSEAKLVSLEIVNGVAFVNFSQEVKTRHWGGSAGERITIQSVVHTLAQLPEVKQVQFLIEGKKEEAIWGHGYTGEPIAPEENILSPS